MTTYDVLFVDDEDDLARSTVDYLTAFGIAAHSVGTAQDALALLRGGDPVRLLLLDVNLPGMSGFDLCRRLPRRPHDSGPADPVPVGPAQRRRRDPRAEPGWRRLPA
ncbi:MAG: response regulator [Austwickia sp.]|nr:response regulator [Austwickia sp.]